MEKFNTKIIKKIQKIKKTTRNRDIRIKLELFILAHKLNNVAEACARRGMSRSFYYKWWNRFKKSFKLKTLHEKSKCPKVSPKKTTRHLENKICELRALGYGCRMIQGVLSREKKNFSTSTINHILNKRKVPVKKRKNNQLNPHRRRYELPIPGQRLQVDVKYFPHLIRGQRAYIFVAVDECTRWRYAKAFMRINADSSVSFMNEVKENCPFPIDCIQTDNGLEFTNRFLTQRINHPLDDWCEEHGIRHKLIPPGVKELNGKVERSHRIDEQYFYWRAPRGSVEGLNSALFDWIKVYNEQRPHGGLKYQTPMEKIRERMNRLKYEEVDVSIEHIKMRYLIEAPVMYLKLYNLGAYKRYPLAA